MNLTQAIEYRLEKLRAQDPDYVVDVLGVQSDELVQIFYRRAVEHVIEEFIDTGDLDE
jgi:hypothetical protein